MTSPNNNYVQAITSFSVANFYQAASVAPFNAAADFAAYVLFYLNGSYQAPGVVAAPPSFLWGNVDAGNNAGWSLSIATGGAPLAGAAIDPILLGQIGTGVALTPFQLPLSLSTVSQWITPGYVERLIHAVLMYDASEGLGALAVNGSIVDFQAVAAYSGSALAPRVGLSPAGTDPAFETSIVSCGYIRDADIFGAIPMGEFAGAVFQTARENNNGALISVPSGIDWLNRWNFNNADQGVLARSSFGARLATGPHAPAAVNDVGGSGVINQTTAFASPNPVALNLNGSLFVTQVKNPDWHAGAGFVFGGG